MAEPDESILRHIAGATVTHAGPYKGLPLPHCERALSRDEINTWVVPFYMSIDSIQLTPLVANLWPLINQKQITLLLSQFGWRERTAAIRLAFLKDINGIETIVGNLLLRSDVCYVGDDYCFWLAQNNTDQSIQYLSQYLDHYLTQHRLYFDQSSAMAAIFWLDELNGTDLHRTYLKRWENFIADKPHWDLEKSVKSFKLRSEEMIQWKSAVQDYLSLQ